MIDLHSHILPGIDDGAQDIETSVEMAKMAVADGTTHIACTPHIMPGIYDNNAAIIKQKIIELKQELANEGVPLNLLIGADVHIGPTLIEGLNAGDIPSLHGTRYFLFEPPHHVMPPKLVEYSKKLLAANYIPILTHPERLTWIENHYDKMVQLDELGVPIQLTAASITGRFGARAKYWSERMLDEGRVDIIASDAHNLKSRPPGLTKAFEIIASRLGEEAAIQIVHENPKLIMENKELPAKKRQVSVVQSNKKRKGFWRWFN
ncbi:MAG: CpsB/CapC family capsule biosynthesis tyrosine phosphatase [Hyphomicrobiales bacterium]